MSEGIDPIPTWSAVTIVVGVVSILLGVVIALLIGASMLLS